MGVDVYAYSNLKKLDCDVDSDGEPVDVELDYFKPYINPDFPGRCDNLDNGAIYGYDDYDNFVSMSYGRYNSWRENLAKLAGYEAIDYDDGFMGTSIIKKLHSAGAWNSESGPFWELINFSDCEGVIGCEVSKKLLEDFKQYQDKAVSTGDEWFIKHYNKFREAFEVASNNGAVSFI